VGAYRRSDGTPVRAHYRRNPGRKAAAGVAVTVSVGITATALSLSGGGSASLSTKGDGARQPGVTLSIGTTIDFARTKSVLVSQGYGVKLAAKTSNDCAAHSYGLTHEFFLSHPCKWLARAWLALRRRGQGLVLVAISWVGMSNANLAEQYKHLVDGSGTGNVTELSREVGPYRDIVFNGNFYSSGIDGNAVWNAQVQPVGPVSNVVLTKIQHDSRQPS
jgi:hypothetical protein